MDDTLYQIAIVLLGLCASAALLYGLWRAIRSPVQPFATFVRAWAAAFAVIRRERKLSLLVLAVFALGQTLQVFFHFFPVLGATALTIGSQVWQICLAVVVALFAAAILTRALPLVTFERPDFDAAARFRQIARPVALWAAAVWLVGLGLSVLLNLAVINSSAEWRWYLGAPTPMLVYLLQTPLILIRPALLFRRTAGEAVATALRRLPSLVLLNLMFSLPPLAVPVVIITLATLAHLGPFSAYIIGQIVGVPFGLLQFLAYELATLIAFGIAADLVPRIRFNRTFSAFHPS